MEKQDVVIENGMDSPGDIPGKESTCNAGDPGSIPGSGRSPWGKNRLYTPVILGFPGSSDGKESACNVGDLGSIPVLGRSPGEGKGYPLQYSWASLVVQMEKNRLGTWEMRVLSLC